MASATEDATSAGAIADRCVARIRLAISEGGPTGERLAYASTTACLRLAGSDEGLTLLVDREPVEVLDGLHPAEIELTLDAGHLERFAAGEPLLQREMLAGRVAVSGPAWKFLRVAPILSGLLSGPEGGAAPNGDRHVAPGAATEPKWDGEGLWAIECRDVHKSFGSTPVLSGVDLGIPEGLITIVVGPSGTGKSVLLKHVIGLLGPDRGEVLVRGEPLSAMTSSELLALRRGMGVLFQDGALWGSMDLFDNVALPLRQHTDLSEVEIAEIVRARLGEVGLGGAEARMPGELSGGMRKRAGLARALVLEPEVMLFDEPDSGLDPVRTALLCELIARIHADHGGTFLVITHDIGVARRIGHYMAALWQGRIVAQGFSDELLASDDPFVRQFLAGEPVGPLGMD